MLVEPEQRDVVAGDDLGERGAAGPRRIDDVQRVREAVQADQAPRRGEHDQRRGRMADHLLHRCADLVTERSAVGQPEHEHLVAAGPGDPQVALRGTDGARRRWELELEAEQGAAGHRVPDLELAEQPEQDLVALEPDRELDLAAGIDRVGGQGAPGRAHDQHLLGIEGGQDDPRARHRGEAHRDLEIETRGGIEIGRLVEHHARLAAAHHGDQRVGRPDGRQIGIGLELEHADGGPDPLAQQQHLATAPQRDELAVGRRGDRHWAPEPGCFANPRTIRTSPSSTAGLSLRDGNAIIELLLPTAAPPSRMICLIWSSVTEACQAGSV